MRTAGFEENTTKMAIGVEQGGKEAILIPSDTLTTPIGPTWAKFD